MLSSRTRLRFPNQGQHAVNSVRRSSIFHRTANYLLTGCLTPGGKRSEYITLLCRLNKENTGVHSFYLFRRIDKGINFKVDERDPW
jgi:hypothetical protein